MKHTFLIKMMIALAIMFGVNSTYAQMSDKQMKKEIKKQVKDFEKEGWKPEAGSSLYSMVLNSFKLQNETMMGQIDRYVSATSIVVAKTFNAAQKEALANSRSEITTLLETEIASIIKQEIENRQIDITNAETEQKMTAVSMQKAKMTLTNLKPVLLIYRKNEKTRNVEVQTRLFYDKKELAKTTKGSVEQMIKEGSIGQMKKELEKE